MTGTSRAEAAGSAPAGRRSRPSRITRIGWPRSGSGAACRTVSDGASASAVPDPTRTASQIRRTSWTRRRLASPEIQRLVPEASARRPSSVIAHLAMTSGRPVRVRLKKAALRRRASSSSTPTVTRRPASRSRARPRPATSGNGSSAAATTRRTPAATIASVQGGVLP